MLYNIDAIKRIFNIFNRKHTFNHDFTEYLITIKYNQ